MPTGESLAIAQQLTAVEALVARGEWAEVCLVLTSARPMVSGNVELSAYYAESLMWLRQPRDAFEWLQPRLDGFARSANVLAWLRSVNLAGAAAFELGRIDEAEALFQTALDHANRSADYLTGGRALNNLALVASTRGDWASAMNYYTLAMPAYERTASKRGMAECSHNIAATLLESGDVERAEEWERRAMELAQETGNERLRGFALNGRAEITLRKRDYALAIVLGQQAAMAFRTLQDKSSEAHALRLIGQAQHGQGALQLAVATLSTATALAVESSVVRVLAECLLARARVYLDLQRVELARRDLEDALLHFTDLGATSKQVDVSKVLSGLPARRPDGAE